MSTGRLTRPVHEQDHAQGDAGAPVTLVEYGDFECPHCGRAYPMVKRLQARLRDRLRFVFRNFPLREIHPHAQAAAEAAESVGRHGGEAGYWAMHDLIFEHQQDGPGALGHAGLLQLAATAGVDPAAVSEDLESGHFEAKVRADFIGGVRSGVDGTPTFFINGFRHDAGWDDVTMLAALEEAAGQGSTR